MGFKTGKEESYCPSSQREKQWEISEHQKGNEGERRKKEPWKS